MATQPQPEAARLLKLASEHLAFLTVLKAAILGDKEAMESLPSMKGRSMEEMKQILSAGEEMSTALLLGARAIAARDQEAKAARKRKNDSLLWFELKEVLPPLLQQVLVWIRDEDGPGFRFGTFMENGDWRIGLTDYVYDIMPKETVTHWCYLQKPGSG